MIGRTIAHYRIVEHIGAGGMGEVFKARDERLHRFVALKFLPSTNDLRASRKRFLQEAQAASSLNHPNIVTVYDVLEHDGEDVIVMEFVEGQSLQELLAAGVLPVDQGLRYATEILGALEAAHSCGIVHRDLKPGNVMISRQGTVKLLDFGLAKVTAAANAESEETTRSRLETETGTILGTPAYMAPEQALGATADARSDLFSLGVLAYEMLTGHRPYPRGAREALLHPDEVTVTNPRALRPEIPRKVDRALRQAVELAPEKRFPSATAMREALQAPASGKPDKRLLAALGAVLGVVAGVAALVSRPDPASRPLPPAKHVAVLALEAIGSGSEDLSVLADGFVETLTSKLTELEPYQRSLLVVPFSEVRAGGIESVAEARRAFSVTLVVTGSFQRSAAGTRLTLNLVDAVELRQVASAILDEPTEQLQELQDGAALRLAGMLGIDVTAPARELLTVAETARADAHELHLEGRGYLQRYDREGNLELAVERFRRSVEADPSYALACASLGEAYWKMYEKTRDASYVELAETYSAKAIELEPDSVPAVVTAGLVESGTGRYEKGVETFLRATTLDPRSAAALQGLARAYEALGRVEDAEAAYLRAIEVRPDYWDAHNQLGVFHWTQGEYDDAVESFRRVTELTPDNYRGYSNLGGILFYLERFDEARDMFERSLRAEPNYLAYSNLGTLLFAQERYRDAARTFEKALALDASDFQVVMNLGSALFWAGENEQAREAFLQALDMLERGLEVNPRDARLLASKGLAQAILGNAAAATPELERALEQAPDDVEVIGIAAEGFESLGERDRALALVDEALRRGYSDTVFRTNPTFRQLIRDPRFTAK